MDIIEEQPFDENNEFEEEENERNEEADEIQDDGYESVVAVESSIDLFDKPLLNIATSALAHMDPALAMLHEAPMKTALISLERVMMTLGGPFMVDLVRFVSGITYYITHIKH